MTFTRVAGSLMSDFIALSKDDVSELVHDDNDQPSRRNTKDDISGLGAGPGAGEGPGAGAGAEEDPGGDEPELQSELCQNHVDDDATHRLSVDDDDAPDLHIPRAGHHPQALAAVQSKQEAYELQASMTGGGGGGGTAPTAKAVQLNADRTGSRGQGEFASPQLFLMVFSSALAVTYA